MFVYLFFSLIPFSRKVPSLRTCFRNRGDTLWACEMKHERIDFQVTETEDVVTAIEDLFGYKFPTTEGPLWCARLLPSTAPLPSSQPDVIASCDFPHIRTLLLANHHGINDGTSNTFIAQSLLHILDDMIADSPVDDEVQMGNLANGEESKAILTAMAEQLREDKDRQQNIIEEANKSRNAEKLIPRAYPMSRGPNPKDQIVMQDLDKETTQNFLKRCKQEGVTVNSAMTAVINISLVDFVREGGLEQDTYTIHELHSVNLRRYFSGNTDKTVGCHMLLPRVLFPTPAKWREVFWEYTRTIHTTILHGLEDKDAFLYLLNMNEGTTPEEIFQKRPYPQCDYAIGNVGNLDRRLTTKRQHISLCHLVRSTACWNDPMYSFFHTLNGCFAYSLVYCTDVLTREMAKRFLEITFDNLKAIVQL
ncbi:hypothetical protein O3P69_013112 [Scylla paramamosain]|uniref:Uncharacterized protein n=1 Tax=Scylla paramamosain TaxID=85552 RepID=A0AAW0U257_SCYPA